MSRIINRNKSQLKIERVQKELGNYLAALARKHELFPLEVQIILHELQEDVLNLMYNQLFDEGKEKEGKESDN